MRKIRSDRLQVRDVIKNACFQNAYWPSKESSVAVVGEPSQGIAAGNPRRAKQWFIIDSIEPYGSGLELHLQTLAPNGARNPKGERLLLRIPGGALMTFKYWGRMSVDGQSIICEVS